MNWNDLKKVMIWNYLGKIHLKKFLYTIKLNVITTYNVLKKTGNNIYKKGPTNFFLQ